MFFRFLLILSLFSLVVYAKQDEDNLYDKKLENYMLKSQQKSLDKKTDLAKIAEEKNNFFLGVGLGATQFMDNSFGVAYPLIYMLRGGYQKYLNNYIAGMRVYGEYLGAVSFDKSNYFLYQLGSFNLDFLADVPLNSDKRYAIGVYGGLGMAWQSYQATQNFNGLGLSINLGISFTLDLKNKLEFGLKIPPFKTMNSAIGSNLYLVSYNYVF